MRSTIVGRASVHLWLPVTVGRMWWDESRKLLIVRRVMLMELVSWVVVWVPTVVEVGRLKCRQCRVLRQVMIRLLLHLLLLLQLK